VKTQTYPVGVDLADQEFILDSLSLPIRLRINPVKPLVSLPLAAMPIVQLRERGPTSSLPRIQGAGIEPSQTVH
jgi:hypothetical protein